MEVLDSSQPNLRLDTSSSDDEDLVTHCKKLEPAFEDIDKVKTTISNIAEETKPRQTGEDNEDSSNEEESQKGKEDEDDSNENQNESSLEDSVNHSEGSGQVIKNKKRKRFSISHVESSSSSDETEKKIRRKKKSKSEEQSNQKPRKKSAMDSTTSMEGTESKLSDQEDNDSAEEEASPASNESEADVKMDQNDSSSDGDDSSPRKNEQTKKEKLKNLNSSLESSSSSDETEKGEAKNVKQKKGDKKSGQKAAKENSRMLSLRRYLSVAGIRIHNYAKIFEGCKSKKAKEAKLLQMLEEQGLKGKPTLEKCKKLRKKIEAKRETAELDVCNIIDYNGNGSNTEGSRASRTTRNKIKSNSGYKQTARQQSANNGNNPFANLTGIIDSEESDNGEKVAAKKKKRVIESEDDSSSKEEKCESD